MTTIAYHQYTNIPYSGGSYNASPITAPMSTNQTPGGIRINHTLGSLPGIHPNPPQFGVADGASEFSNSRRYYWRTAQSVDAQAAATVAAKASRPSNFTAYTSQRQYAVSTHMNYIPPKESSQRTEMLKAKAVGKSSYKIGLPVDANLSYKSYNKNDVKTALKFARSGGCVAPAKKGSIYNRSLCNGRVCAWGAQVSSNYS
jgi:hypothetical protein